MHCKGYKIWIAARSLAVFLLSHFSCAFRLAFIYQKADVILCSLRGTKNAALWYANVRLIKWHLGNLCNDTLLLTWRLWQFESRQFYCEPAWFLQWVAGNYFRQSILSFFRELILSLALPFERKHLLNETESAYWIKQILDWSINPDSSAYRYVIKYTEYIHMHEQGINWSERHVLAHV